MSPKRLAASTAVRCTLGTVALAGLTPIAGAQQTDSSHANTASHAAPAAVGLDDADHSTALFTRRDAYVAASFVAAATALFPLDERIARNLQRSGVQSHSGVDHAATGVEFLAIPGVFVASGTAYVVGRLGHYATLADVGLHVGGATVAASAITQVLKAAVGRARPYVTADTDSRAFQFGRGFRKGEDYTSFPAGHPTVAFAAASALTSETAHWWPHETRYVAPIAYGGATLVALARMYHNDHWASDVVMGAGIGTLSGFTVVRHQHEHPGNRIDRWFLTASVAPVRGGAVLAWNVPM